MMEMDLKIQTMKKEEIHLLSPNDDYELFLDMN